MPNEVIRVALVGDGTLEADWDDSNQRFVILRTDEGGRIHFRWEGATPSNVILNASAASGNSLSIRRT